MFMLRNLSFFTFLALCSVHVCFAESWQVRLDRDIQTMNLKLSPSKQSQAARMNLLAKLNTTIHQIWPTATMVPFGSTVTGLNTVSSDADVFIAGIPGIYSTLPIYFSAILKSLSTLKLKLMEQKEFIVTKLVPSCIPLLRVRYVDLNETVSADISIQEFKTYESTRLVQNYISSDPVIVPVHKVIKTLLTKHQLNSYFTGGLKSVAVAFMLAHMIQANAMNTRQMTAAEILLSFLQLYGHDLNPRTTILYPSTMDYLDRAVGIEMNRNSTLVLVNPADLSRDMTRGTRRYEEVRRLFIETLAQLQSGVPLSQII